MTVFILGYSFLKVFYLKCMLFKIERFFLSCVTVVSP